MEDDRLVDYLAECLAEELKIAEGAGQSKPSRDKACYRYSAFRQVRQFVENHKTKGATAVDGTPIPGGVYYFFSDGCGWESVKIRDGKRVWSGAECEQATHDAARDSLAGYGPPDDEDDELSLPIDPDVRAALIRLCCDPDSHPDLIDVRRYE